MKTPYLDSAIEMYERMQFSESEKEKLKEYKSIKEALSIHDVMQSDYTPDMIAKHLEWDSYDHMKINEEHIEPQFKEAINMIFWLCKLEVPFYSA